MMELLTVQDRARNTAASWDKQYRNYKGPDPRNKQEILAGLRSLGKNPIPDEINKIIGNSSWTDLRCNECKMRVEAVIRIGDEPDYDSATANVCKRCLEKAVTKIKKRG